MNAAEIWRLLDNEGITHFDAAATVLVAVANAQQAHRLRRPVIVTTGGAPPSPTIIARMSELGARIVHFYGLTETYGPYTVCEIQDSWARLDPQARYKMMARQGVGMIVTDGVRVVAEDMTDVPRDGVTMGEVVMRGNDVMSGYFNDPEATKGRRLTKGEIKYGKLDVLDFTQLALPFWSASEARSGRRLFVQRHSRNDRTTGAERRRASKGWDSR